MKATAPRHRSFGIPPEMKAQVASQQAAREAQDAAATGGDEADEQDGETSDEAPAPSEGESAEMAPQSSADLLAQSSSPEEILKRLGVELTAEDFNRLLFKGYIAKDIKICYDPHKGKDYVGTFKTLTATEFDLVDELLSEELEAIKMTVNGREQRRSAWILAFALTHINGMELQKPVKGKGGAADPLETARTKVKVVRALAPFVLDKAARIYGALSAALALTMEDPEKTFVKKP